MDTVIGITGKDFVLMASDAMCGRSIIVFKQDEDKQVQLNPKVVMGMAGGAADRDQFGSLIKRNIILKELRDQRVLSTSEVVNFTRTELHEAVRSKPVQVNLLIGGVDEVDDKNNETVTTPITATTSTDEKSEKSEKNEKINKIVVPSLYYMDYLASMIQVPYGIQGHASNFLLSLLDAEWKKDLTQEEVFNLFKKCRAELNARFLVSFAAWKVRVITKDGVEEVEIA
jgi:20S proteasome alpha/beta subunit